MAESYRADATLAGYSGSTDNDTGLPHLTIGGANWHEHRLRLHDWISRILQRTANALRVYKDDAGALKYGVRPGRFFNGNSVVTYAGASDQSLTDDATNYVYLTAAGALTINTTGFPDPAVTPHVRLATVATGSASAAAVSGAYAVGDIADWRDTALLTVADNMTAANANTLTGGGNADALHVHDTAGITANAITAALLSAALRGVIPSLSITAGAEASDIRAVTVQAKDAAEIDLAQRLLIRVWIAGSEGGAPDATGNTATVTTGTAIESKTANADYHLISDTNGKIVFNLEIAGAASRYVMAEVDGRIYSSGQLDWAA